MTEFDANAGWAIVLTHGRKETNHRVARIAVLVRHQSIHVGAGLVGEEVAERIKDHRVAAVCSSVGLDRLQHVGMVPHDDRGPGVEHLVRNFDVFWPGSRGVLNAPMDRNHEQVALGAGSLNGGQNLGLVRARRLRPTHPDKGKS